MSESNEIIKIPTGQIEACQSKEFVEKFLENSENHQKVVEIVERFFESYLENREKLGIPEFKEKTYYYGQDKNKEEKLFYLSTKTPKAEEFLSVLKNLEPDTLNKLLSTVALLSKSGKKVSNEAVNQVLTNKEGIKTLVDLEKEFYSQKSCPAWIIDRNKSFKLDEETREKYKNYNILSEAEEVGDDFDTLVALYKELNDEEKKLNEEFLIEKFKKGKYILTQKFPFDCNYFIKKEDQEGLQKLAETPGQRAGRAIDSVELQNNLKEILGEEKFAEFYQKLAETLGQEAGRAIDSVELQNNLKKILGPEKFAEFCQKLAETPGQRGVLAIDFVELQNNLKEILEPEKFEEFCQKLAETPGQAAGLAIGSVESQNNLKEILGPEKFAKFCLELAKTPGQEAGLAINSDEKQNNLKKILGEKRYNEFEGLAA